MVDTINVIFDSDCKNLLVCNFYLRKPTFVFCLNIDSGNIDLITIKSNIFGKLTCDILVKIVSCPIDLEPSDMLVLFQPVTCLSHRVEIYFTYVITIQTTPSSFSLGWNKELWFELFFFKNFFTEIIITSVKNKV